VQAKTAHRRLGRGQGRAQVMADGREQRRLFPICLGRLRGWPGQEKSLRITAVFIAI
jgi:hypothetical protein